MNQPVIVVRSYAADPSRVWGAITDVRQMRQWYFDVDDFRPEVGFEFSFTGGTPERQYVHRCRVTEVVPGQLLRHTWRYEGYEGDSEVLWELFPEGTGTRVQLTHSGLERFPGDGDFARGNFEAGWTQILAGPLRSFVEAAALSS